MTTTTKCSSTGVKAKGCQDSTSDLLLNCLKYLPCMVRKNPQLHEISIRGVLQVLHVENLPLNQLPGILLEPWAHTVKDLAHFCFIGASGR